MHLVERVLVPARVGLKKGNGVDELLAALLGGVTAAKGGRGARQAPFERVRARLLRVERALVARLQLK